MDKLQSKIEISTQSWSDPAELRINVVSQQRKIENKFVKDLKGRAFFLVNTPLTPLYIDPNVVDVDAKAYDTFKINHTNFKFIKISE
jgi:hypothetical protein